MSKLRLRIVTTGAVCVALAGLAACSSDKTTEPPSSTQQYDRRHGAPAVTTTTVPRPAGPAAEISSELTGGKGVFVAEGTAPDLDALGYVQHEYAAAGTATSYKIGGRAHTRRPLEVRARCARRAYRTRVVVRAPADAAKFSGTVVVEWLNVSGGVDADPEWTSLQEEIVRAGRRVGRRVGPAHRRRGRTGAVKVSGVAGAEDQGKGLKKIDPARYGSLVHPGDGYSFDIFTQVARALRTGGALGRPAAAATSSRRANRSRRSRSSSYYQRRAAAHARVRRLLRAQPRRGRAPARRARASTPTSRARSAVRRRSSAPIRTCPVLDIQTETDVASILNSYAARQPDNDHFRLWEVAGTAHADAHLVGPSAKYHRLRRADQQRPDAHRRQGGAARAHDVDQHRARRRSPRRAST